MLFSHPDLTATSGQSRVPWWGVAGQPWSRPAKPMIMPDSRHSGPGALCRPRRRTSGQRLRLLDERLGVADLELARCLDVEHPDDAVLDEHRVALRANAHAARGQVEGQTGRLREAGAAVGHHADLACGVLVAAPGAHDEGVVDGDAPD